MTGWTSIRMTVRGSIAAILLMLGAMAMASSASAAEGAHEAAWWQLDSRTAPRLLPPNGGEGQIEAIATNLGDAAVKGTSEDPVTLTDTVPAGFEVLSANMTAGSFPRTVQASTCPTEDLLDGRTLVTCTFTHLLEPYERIELKINVRTSGTPAGSNEVRIEGGEGEGGVNLDTPVGEPTSPPPFVAHIEAGEAPTSFGVERYTLRPEGDTGMPDTRAGSHPFQMTTTLDFNQTFESRFSAKKFAAVPVQARNLSFLLPPGLVGNTTAVPQCPDGDFATLLERNTNLCKPDTAIGVAVVTINEPRFEPAATEVVPVFNLVPSGGEPARLGFEVDRVSVYLDTEVRTGSDYAVVVNAHDTSTAAMVLSSVVTIWGEPGDPRHDGARGWGCVFTKIRTCEPLSESERAAGPYLRMPTSCIGQPTTEVSGDSWPVSTGTTGVELPRVEQLMEPLTGCEDLPFDPSITVEPEETSASTPTGLNVTLNVPQGPTLEPGGLSEADVRANTVALPVGVEANAGSANQLLTCSAAQMGFLLGASEEERQTENDHFSPTLPEPTLALPEPPCPTESKIGTVSIKTPLLPEELTGAVYMAAQNVNPFRSPLALYIVAQAPKSKVLVKLAGEVNIDSATGQLTTTFKNTPDTPFEELKLHLFNGARASQATPAFCGTYTTKASFTPWGQEGAPPVGREPSFQITSGPGGGPCPSSPLALAPGFAAGSTNLQAGAFTPFTMTIARPDGQQALHQITLHTPPGLAAVIANAQRCPNPLAIPLETEEEPPCPAGSLIGHTTSLSGLGGDPVTLPGNVYLTEGYGGAPFGLLAVTHAEAGEFNLGYVNVRSQIFVDRETTAVTVVSEPIPQMVKGVPSQLKQLTVTVDRPGFEFNPTSCDPMSVTGTVNGWEGANVAVSSPFQVANCAALPFAPKLKAKVSGKGSKANGVTFNVTIESPGLGQANIHKVDLTLPEALPSRLTTIQKACLDSVFEANPAACDEGSVIGEGIVQTPVLANPLRGPAYLVSHGNAAFPDVEFVLQGEGVTIVVDGKTDIKKGITYSKFETSPDAPFTKFESIFPAGPHSALTAYVPVSENYSLCKAKLAMPTEIEGQNGSLITGTTTIEPEGCGGVAGFKASSAKKLAKALKQCRKRHKHSKRKRLACERRAHKRYGPKKLAKTLKHCDKRYKHNAKKRVACENRALRKYTRAKHARAKHARKKHHR